MPLWYPRGRLIATIQATHKHTHTHTTDTTCLLLCGCVCVFRQLLLKMREYQNKVVLVLRSYPARLESCRNSPKGRSRAIIKEKERRTIVRRLAPQMVAGRDYSKRNQALSRGQKDCVDVWRLEKATGAAAFYTAIKTTKEEPSGNRHRRVREELLLVVNKELFWVEREIERAEGLG